MDQFAAMASRRSMVHNGSKTGRKRLVDMIGFLFMSWKNNIDMFEAIVDDLAKALIQWPHYSKFMEKGIIGWEIKKNRNCCFLLDLNSCHLQYLPKDI